MSAAPSDPKSPRRHETPAAPFSLYGSTPTLLLLANGDRGAAIAAIAQALGVRVVNIVGLADAMAQLDRTVAVDAIYVALDDTAGKDVADGGAGEEAGAKKDGESDSHGLDPALELRLQMIVRAGQSRLIIECNLAQVDAIDRAFHLPLAHFMASPNDSERQLALAQLSHTEAPAVADSGSTTHEIDQLRQEVARIAASLAQLSLPHANQLVGAAAPITPPSPFTDDHIVSDQIARFRQGAPTVPLGQDDASANGPNGVIHARDVRQMIAQRRLRDRYFPADLFAGPAWDIMLDLLAAKLERKPVSVSSLCIAAAVPPTTALRWIRTMTESGLLERVPDPLDGRRVFIELGKPAEQALRQYFQALTDTRLLV